MNDAQEQFTLHRYSGEPAQRLCDQLCLVITALPSALWVKRHRKDRVRCNAPDPAAIRLIRLPCVDGGIIPPIGILKAVHAPDDGAPIDKDRSALHIRMLPSDAVCAVFPAHAVRFEGFSAAEAVRRRHPRELFLAVRADVRDTVIREQLLLHLVADRAGARK